MGERGFSKSIEIAAAQQVIVVPKKITRVCVWRGGGYLAGSPFRTCYLHSQGKNLDAKAEETKYKLVHETDVTPLSHRLLQT